ncbi:PIN domain-containing protein [Lipomyces arxii]|uniref:PIN domain-containing protein n=1 Tax=Lipomyces arxii TaxID=56418 RepID=UPI0034CEF964
MDNDDECFMDIAEEELDSITDAVTLNRSNNIQAEHIYTIDSFVCVFFLFLQINSILTSTKSSDYNQDTVSHASALYVVDTNFVLSHLHMLDSLLQYHRQFGPVLLFPLTVVHELDKLKSGSPISDVHARNRYMADVPMLARKANDWLFKALARMDPGVRGQRANERLERENFGDDSIVDCCRFYNDCVHKSVFLFSNDKNLCAKALIHGIRTVSYVSGLSARDIVVATLNLPEHVVPIEAATVAKFHTAKPLEEVDDDDEEMDMFDQMDIDRPKGLTNLPSKFESVRLPFWAHRGPKTRTFTDPTLTPDSPYSSSSTFKPVSRTLVPEADGDDIMRDSTTVLTGLSQSKYARRRPPN